MQITYNMNNGTVIGPNPEHSDNAAPDPEHYAAPEVELRLQEVEWSVEEESEPSIWATGVSIKTLLK